MNLQIRKKKIQSHLTWKRKNKNQIRLSRALKLIFDSESIMRASDEQIRISAIYRLIRLSERKLITTEESRDFYNQLMISEDVRSLALSIYKLPKEDGGMNYVR
jgi:hypothetical protein